MALIKNWIDIAAPPAKAVPTPSGFADWVYCNANTKKNVGASGDKADKDRLDIAAYAHDRIEFFTRHVWTRGAIGDLDTPDWRLYYLGRDDERPSPFRMSRLSIGGAPVKGYPDLVLHNENKNIFIVLERKTTYVNERFLPRKGWPNVEAQLWCYSWIDEFQNAEEVLLVGEVWRRGAPQKSGKMNPLLKLYKTHWLWKRSDLEHQRRCSRWWTKYGGDIA